MTQRNERTPMSAEHRKVILASSLGAMFEWYDFYLYGVLAPVFAARFFAGLAGPRRWWPRCSPSRPASWCARRRAVFGRLGDLIGRKYTFLVTLLLMGGATFAIGVLPDTAPSASPPGGAGAAATAAGLGHRRRVRWCGDLCRRACAALAGAASIPAGSRPPHRSA
jgi:MFS family permease